MIDYHARRGLPPAPRLGPGFGARSLLISIGARPTYQLAHTAAVNLSDQDRIAIYFRVWLADIDERRWQLLTNIWDGWRL
jgi:hypothetical protein